jgi:membrane-bound lytic murein transglycosylase A
MKKARLALSLLFMLAGCAGVSEPDKLTLTPVSYEELPGWSAGQQREALPALARSCAVLAKKKNSKWQQPCAALEQVSPQNDAAARAFFEQYFTPQLASGNQGEMGLFTGYYEAELNGSLQKTGQFHFPLYARPRDLITVDLGLFRKEWKGQRIAGKVDRTKLIPYDDRAQIEENKLEGRADVLLWVDGEVDAFFLAIQGSGRARLPDGNYIRIGYDGANGRAYVALGKVLADMNEIERPVTMQKIRAWLADHPDRAQTVMNMNPSYVFFRRIEGDGPIGAQGVALTPQNSLAVDPAFIAYGTPLWLDTMDGNGAVLEKLVIAQDTGGAIKGPVRGDFFWGYGKEAAAQAGAMQSQGRYYLLMPKETARDAGE